MISIWRTFLLLRGALYWLGRDTPQAGSDKKGVIITRGSEEAQGWNSLKWQVGNQGWNLWFWLVYSIASTISIQPLVSTTMNLKFTLHHSQTQTLNSVQFSSVAQLCPTLCNPKNYSMPALPAHHQLPSSLRLTSIELVMPSSHLILGRLLLLPPPIPPSIRDFSNESTLRMRWPKYWSFSFSIIPSKEHPELIFRMDRLDLLAVQGTFKSLL